MKNLILVLLFFVACSVEQSDVVMKKVCNDGEASLYQITVNAPYKCTAKIYYQADGVLYNTSFGVNYGENIKTISGFGLCPNDFSLVRWQFE